MKKSIYLPAGALFLALNGCVPVQKSATTKTTDIYGAGVLHMPVVVDLDVSQTKSTGSANAVNATFLEAAKQEAIAQILQNSKADVLVEPSYQTVSHGAAITVVVTGYPAFYKDFRKAKAEDIPLLQVGQLKKAETYEAAKAMPAKKGNPAAAVAGTLLTIGLVVLLLVLLI
jgi:hypothetical protein